MSGHDKPHDSNDRAARLRPLIVARCRALVGNTDAEDVAQEVLVRLHLRFAHDPDVTDRDMLRWAATVAHNIVASEFRSARRRWEQPHADPAAVREPAEDGHEQDVTGRLWVDAVLTEGTEVERDRALIGLTVAGLNSREIARLLSLDGNTVRQAMLRARRRIAAHLRRTGREQGAVLPVLAAWRRRWTTLDPAVERVAPSVVVVSTALAWSLVATGTPAPAATRDSRVAPGLRLPSATVKRPGPSNLGGQVVGPGRTGVSKRGADPGAVRHQPAPAPAPAATPAPRSPRLVPVPAACAGRVCVGTPPPGYAGDTLTLRGHEDVSVTQKEAPVCEWVPDGGPVTCTRQEPERWTVKDVPPPPTGGATP